jgi:hypothetical protein
VEFLLSLPKQDKEELMMLVGMSTMEWEKRAHEERERLAEAEQAQVRRIVSSAGESGQARPKASSFGRPVIGYPIRKRALMLTNAPKRTRGRPARHTGSAAKRRLRWAVPAFAARDQRWWAWQPYERLTEGPGGFCTTTRTVD